METKRSDFYKEEKPFEVNLVEYLGRMLTGVENFLKKVQKHDQTSLSIITDELKHRVESKEYTFRTPSGDLPLLSKYEDLRKEITNYLLHPFDAHQPITQDSETIMATVRSWLRSRLFLYYQMAKSLTTIMSKEEAIQFFQEYTDEQTRAMRNPANFHEAVEDNNPEMMKFLETYASHNIVNFVVNKWKQGHKMLKCKWHEVMKELNDPEFSYAVACHYDFEAIKNINPEFVLTRMKTLMEGHEYCDFCIHDSRNIEVSHPSEEFWNDLK